MYPWIHAGFKRSGLDQLRLRGILRGSHSFSFTQWCAAVFVFLTISALPNSAAADAPVNPNANATAVAILSYLTALGQQTTGPAKLISGQWIGWAQAQDTTEISYIAANSSPSQTPGLVGADYCGAGGITTSVANSTLEGYWNSGSLVEVDVVMPNPWTETGWCGKGVAGGNGFSDVITPGTTAYTNYMNDLASVAAGLADLQTHGVVVLFRILMEGDGNWFWWGTASNEAYTKANYKALWTQTFNYLTTGTATDATTITPLNNLLWVYAAATNNLALTYYPGPKWADIVGFDTYGYGSGGFVTPQAYTDLTTLTKPYAMTEFGLQSSTAPYTEPAYDLNTAISDIKNNMPKAVYFMCWSFGGNSPYTETGPGGTGTNGVYWGIDGQNNFSTALNKGWVQNSPVPW